MMTDNCQSPHEWGQPLYSEGWHGLLVQGRLWHQQSADKELCSNSMSSALTPIYLLDSTALSGDAAASILALTGEEGSVFVDVGRSAFVYLRNKLTPRCSCIVRRSTGFNFGIAVCRVRGAAFSLTSRETFVGQVGCMAKAAAWHRWSVNVDSTGIWKKASQQFWNSMVTYWLYSLQTWTTTNGQIKKITHSK